MRQFPASSPDCCCAPDRRSRRDRTERAVYRTARDDARPYFRSSRPNREGGNMSLQRSSSWVLSAVFVLVGGIGTSQATDIFSPPLTAQSGQVLTCSITNVKTSGTVTIDFAGIVGPDGNGLSQASNTCGSLSGGALDPQHTCSATTSVSGEGHCWIRTNSVSVSRDHGARRDIRHDPERVACDQLNAEARL